jgi:hypothetical protein
MTLIKLGCFNATQIGYQLEAAAVQCQPFQRLAKNFNSHHQFLKEMFEQCSL